MKLKVFSFITIGHFIPLLVISFLFFYSLWYFFTYETIIFQQILIIIFGLLFVIFPLFIYNRHKSFSDTLDSIKGVEDYRGVFFSLGDKSILYKGRELIYSFKLKEKPTMSRSVFEYSVKTKVSSPQEFKIRVSLSQSPFGRFSDTVKKELEKFNNEFGISSISLKNKELKVSCMVTIERTDTGVRINNKVYPANFRFDGVFLKELFRVVYNVANELK